MGSYPLMDLDEFWVLIDNASMRIINKGNTRSLVLFRHSHYSLVVWDNYTETWWYIHPDWTERILRQYVLSARRIFIGVELGINYEEVVFD
jgi:hypothetical protein